MIRDHGSEVLDTITKDMKAGGSRAADARTWVVRFSGEKVSVMANSMPKTAVQTVVEHAGTEASRTIPLCS